MEDGRNITGAERLLSTVQYNTIRYVQNRCCMHIPVAASDTTARLQVYWSSIWSFNCHWAYLPLFYAS